MCSIDYYVLWKYMKGSENMENEPTVQIGEQVLDFKLPVYHRESLDDEISLFALLGKGAKKNSKDKKEKWVVVFFYPADGTFNCPKEIEDLVNHYEKFTERNTEIVAVSTDSLECHYLWKHSVGARAIANITFPWGSDQNGKLSRYFAVYRDNGRARRATFLIDPDGILMATEIVDDAISRSAPELLRKLEALQFTRDNPGYVCPAGWTKEEGKKGALKKGKDLIGNI
jgi:NADH-dependent peroxiredoxin subunit C